MSILPVAPEALGETIREISAALLAQERKMTQGAALYREKRGGFQCGTCRMAVPVNATHGRCAIVVGTIHLADGCCAAWAPDEAQLHLYRQPV